MQAGLAALGDPGDDGVVAQPPGLLDDGLLHLDRPARLRDQHRVRPSRDISQFPRSSTVGNGTNRRWNAKAATVFRAESIALAAGPDGRQSPPAPQSRFSEADVEGQRQRLVV